MSQKPCDIAAISEPASENASDKQSINLDNAAATRVLRKIDWYLIPLLFVTYNLNFMDKTILSSASVFGLRHDTHLVGQQYSWVSSGRLKLSTDVETADKTIVFYFGYFFWEYPTSYLIQKLPVGKYVGINTLFWGWYEIIKCLESP